MPSCKLAVIRKLGGSFLVGDVVAIHPSDVSFGGGVENFGGMYSVVEITDADRSNPDLVKLLEVGNTTRRKYYIRPPLEGEAYCNELLNSQRVSVTLAEIIANTLER